MFSDLFIVIMNKLPAPNLQTGSREIYHYQLIIANKIPTKYLQFGRKHGKGKHFNSDIKASMNKFGRPSST